MMYREQIIKALNGLNFTALDFETANEQRNSICSAGFIIVENGKIINKKSFLIKPPEMRFTEINKRIHGISEIVVKDSQEFDVVWEEIRGFIENTLLLAHNCDFDIDALKQTLKTYNLALPDFSTICTQKLAQEVFSDLLDYRLPDVANYLGLTLNHHDCISDAAIAAEIGIAAIPQFDYSNYSFGYEELTHYIQKKSSLNKKNNYLSDFNKKLMDRNLLKPNLEVANPDNYFFNKRVVFTGDLQKITRQEAATRVQALGADINTSISKNTEIVIAGNGAGPAKMKKVADLKTAGINIHIMSEDEFFKVLDSPGPIIDKRIQAAAKKLSIMFSQDEDIPPRLKEGYEEKTKPNLNSMAEVRFRENVVEWKNVIEVMQSKVEEEQTWRFISLIPRIESNLKSVTLCQDFIDLTNYFVLRRDEENCSDIELGLLSLLHTTFQKEIEAKLG